MLATYRAILKGNRLHWAADAPENLQPGDEVEVYVTILDLPQKNIVSEKQAAGMVDALRKLAKLNAVSTISNPSKWQ